MATLVKEKVKLTESETAVTEAWRKKKLPDFTSMGLLGYAAEK